MPPTDPLAAASSRDPYPFYASLVANAPFYRDGRLGLWVASSAAAVAAVLGSDRCRARPADEPAPKHLLGSPLEAIFRSLVRMNDGASHCPLKRAVSATLEPLEPAAISRRSCDWADRLIAALRPIDRPGELTTFAFHLPVYVLADLLGAEAALLPGLAASVGDLAASLGPAGSASDERGLRAAAHLQSTFAALLDAQEARGEPRLLGDLALQSRLAGVSDRQIAIANGIGLLIQAYEASAGLIGNTLFALARHPAARAQVLADVGLLGPAIQEVLRYDPPVQNTRRFVSADVRLAGCELRAGDSILVMLAAANRDPAANPRPDRFELLRTERRSFTFGLGVHACPAAVLVPLIAGSAIERLLAAGLDLDRLLAPAYRPAPNTRIPLWA